MSTAFVTVCDAWREKAAVPDQWYERLQSSQITAHLESITVPYTPLQTTPTTSPRKQSSIKRKLIRTVSMSSSLRRTLSKESMPRSMSLSSEGHKPGGLLRVLSRSSLRSRDSAPTEPTSPVTTFRLSKCHLSTQMRLWIQDYQLQLTCTPLILNDNQLGSPVRYKAHICAVPWPETIQSPTILRVEPEEILIVTLEWRSHQDDVWLACSEERGWDRAGFIFTANIMKFVCTSCSATMSEVPELHNHYLHIHQQCPGCGIRVSDDESERLLHLKQCDYFCVSCARSFIQKEYYEEHMSSVHNKQHFFDK